MATTSFDKEFIVTDEDIIVKFKEDLSADYFADAGSWEEGTLGRDEEFVSVVTLPEELIQRMLKVAKDKIER